MASLNHQACTVSHYWLCLDVQVSEHNIRAPAAEQLNKSVSTLAHSSAKTPPARRALTLISFGRKPTLGPWRVTSTRRAVTLAGETPDHCCVESRRPGMIATEKRKAKPISDDSTLTRINFCTDESTVTIYLISVDCQRNDDPPNQQFA